MFPFFFNTQNAPTTNPRNLVIITKCSGFRFLPLDMGHSQSTGPTVLYHLSSYLKFSIENSHGVWNNLQILEPADTYKSTRGIVTGSSMIYYEFKEKANSKSNIKFGVKCHHFFG